jgi:kynureninase
MKISPRYNRIGVDFDFNAIFIFKFSYLDAHPGSHVGAFASGRHTAGEQIALAGHSGPQELFIGKYLQGNTALAGHRGPQELLIS